MRLGIYAFYDSDGIADDGDLIYLDAINAELDKLIIVVNGMLSSQSRIAFEQYTSHIILRENRGYDGGAFRDVLLEHLPRTIWDAVDELVLFNNTVYGPLRPLEPIFNEFSASSADFWGMTLNRMPTLPVHLQSYFLVFKRAVLQSSVFWRFWQQLRMDFTDVEYIVVSYEYRITALLRQAGFRCEAVQIMDSNMTYVEPLRGYQIGIPVLKKKIFRSAGYGISVSEYKKLLECLTNEHPRIAAAVRSYMRRHHFAWQDTKSSQEESLCWTNEAIMAAVSPYCQIYFYGWTARSVYLMSQLVGKQCFFVESDAFYRGPWQGEYRILRMSELSFHYGDDTLMVVFLRKHNAECLRGTLESFFEHVIYLCDPLI